MREEFESDDVTSICTPPIHRLQLSNINPSLTPRKQPSTMSRRILLLTLDAFNTIFHPRLPIGVQYTQTAQSLGFLPPTTPSPDVVQSAFRAAYKHQSALRPNYGRQIAGFGGPRDWWGCVIRECFARVTRRDDDGGRRRTVREEEEDVPEELVQRLLRRFEGREGYALYPDAGVFFKRLNRWKENARRRSNSSSSANGIGLDWIVVGILSNSDDRVASILPSLGVRVGTAWADNGELISPTGTKVGNGLYDVDFIVTSYEAGSEKPEKGIFEVAEKRAKEHLLTTEFNRIHSSSDQERDIWSYVHVGDDYEQDYVGAIKAGWDCFLLPRDGIRHAPEESSLDNVKRIKTLEDLFPRLGL
jgi:FMN phosphatase YigB (HAD superfamily)